MNTPKPTLAQAHAAFEVLKLKASSGAMSTEERLDTSSIFALSLLCGNKGTRAQRLALAKSAHSVARLTGAAAILDTILDGLEKNIPIETILLACIDVFESSVDKASTKLEAAATTFDPKHICQFESEPE